MEDIRKKKLWVLKIFAAFLFIVGIFVAGFLIGEKVGGERIYSGQDTQTITQLQNIRTEYKNLDVSVLYDVWDELNTKYLLKNIDNEELFRSAVKGLVDGLGDPYTTYLTSDELAAVNQSDSGQLEGIGVTLREEGQYVVVESVVDGYPASKNGIKSGDIILVVNENDMVSKTAYEAASLIRGQAGTKVSLTIFRPSDQDEIQLEITREKIDIDNIVLGEVVEGVATIKIYKFTESSVDDFKNMWDTVVTSVVALDPKGIIIDLRGNPGGYVSGVEYILGDLLPRGSVTFFEEDRNGNRTSHTVERNGRLTNIPIVVIVNAGSASASEIMTGALQDYQRAVVVGEKTVGKGVEQQLVTFADGSQLRLVFQKWLTPKGNNISSDNPITPDYLIEDYSDQTEKAFELLQ